jgi:hypothetical protein
MAKKSKSKKPTSRKRELTLKKKLAQQKKKLAKLEKELQAARKIIRRREGPAYKPKRYLSRKEMIDQFMDRAERLYGSGPGLLDTAHDLADYYEIDLDQIFDEWYEETG